MSWFKAALLCVALAGCGFTPVYGPGGTGSQLQNRVLVDPPRDREGFLLVQYLEDRLGRAQDPAYRLAVALTLSEEARAIDADGDIRRFHVIGAAQYSLTETATGVILGSGAVDNFVGYSATGSTVATLAAQRDAEARLLTSLADQMIVQIQALDL